uniref:Uncharacterized protein n=1 Tax=Sinocyclocheilus rhinocerous TaxID=307959 RepID=A0A673MBJ4_9TELE
MVLLLDQLLPDTNEITTKTFLESVSHLPPFFGESLTSTCDFRKLQ